MPRRPTGACLLAGLVAAICIAPTGFVGNASAVSLGGACAGVAGRGCDAGLWCELEADSCGNAAAAGTCVSVPHSCGWSIGPVCGCSGKTFRNDCERQRAKVNKAHGGACRPREQYHRSREAPDDEPDARQGGR